MALLLQELQLSESLSEQEALAALLQDAPPTVRVTPRVTPTVRVTLRVTSTVRVTPHVTRRCSRD